VSLVSEAFQRLEEERSRPVAVLRSVTRTYRSHGAYTQKTLTLYTGTIEEMRAELERLASTYGVSTRRSRFNLWTVRAAGIERKRCPFIRVWYHVREERGESHEGRTAAGRS
jgi:hypothetical protein